MSSRLKSVVIGSALAAALSACSPITQVQGYQVVDEQPATAKVGEDTLQTVRTRFGTPTIVSTFDPNVWFYVNQVNDTFGFYRPHIRNRQVVAITFDKATQKVASVNTYTEKDGHVIAYNGRETPTRGKELSVIEQILGTIGTRALPQEEDDPGRVGQRP
ncbi:MAG TPA: outer membrane protein assembly factor BamE [Caulobacteraceae bacterium]|nr:outer membrane protein assembly factor BamE [Caulobacteraceae bacterium]